MCHFSTDSYNMYVNISHTVLIASVNMHQINIGCVTLCILFHNNRINHTNLLMGISYAMILHYNLALAGEQDIDSSHIKQSFKLKVQRGHKT